MIQKIVPVTHPNLRKTSKPVNKIDKKVKTIIQDLKDTLMAQDNPPGVGLAGPQIGKNVRIFAMKPKDKIKIIINPEILSISEKRAGQSKNKSSSGGKTMEGCLSLPHYYGPLTRAAKIKIKYLTESGEETVEMFEKFPAQIVQHEIDHLDGKLFIDRLLETKIPLYKFKNNQWEEVDL